MNNLVKKLLAPVLLGLVSAAATAGAQGSVGYTPGTSPYVDMPYNQEWTLLVGNFHAHRDPANVGPQSGTLVGLHYEWRASGPLYLLSEIAGMSSDRRLINPLKAGAARELGTVSRPLYTWDAGLGLGLTGGKTWHHLAPEVSTGVGLISDFRTAADSGGFRFGTRFAFNMGAGLKIVPGGRWQIRGDVKDRMYTLAYPEPYFVAPTGGTAVVPSTQAKSFWQHNPTLSLGLSWLF